MAQQEEVVCLGQHGLHMDKKWCLLSQGDWCRGYGCAQHKGGRISIYQEKENNAGNIEKRK